MYKALLQLVFNSLGENANPFDATVINKINDINLQKFFFMKKAKIIIS